MGNSRSRSKKYTDKKYTTSTDQRENTFGYVEYNRLGKPTRTCPKSEQQVSNNDLTIYTKDTDGSRSKDNKGTESPNTRGSNIKKVVFEPRMPSTIIKELEDNLSNQRLKTENSEHIYENVSSITTANKTVYTPKDQHQNAVYTERDKSKKRFSWSLVDDPSRTRRPSLPHDVFSTRRHNNGFRDIHHPRRLVLEKKSFHSSDNNLIKGNNTRIMKHQDLFKSDNKHHDYKTSIVLKRMEARERSRLSSVHDSRTLQFRDERHGIQSTSTSDLCTLDTDVVQKSSNATGLHISHREDFTDQEEMNEQTDLETPQKYVSCANIGKTDEIETEEENVSGGNYDNNWSAFRTNETTNSLQRNDLPNTDPFDGALMDTKPISDKLTCNKPERMDGVHQRNGLPADSLDETITSNVNEVVQKGLPFNDHSNFLITNVVNREPSVSYTDPMLDTGAFSYNKKHWSLSEGVNHLPNNDGTASSSEDTLSSQIDVEIYIYYRNHPFILAPKHAKIENTMNDIYRIIEGDQSSDVTLFHGDKELECSEDFDHALGIASYPVRLDVVIHPVERVPEECLRKFNLFDMIDGDFTDKSAIMVQMSCGHATTPENLYNYCLSTIRTKKSEISCLSNGCKEKWDFEDISKKACLSDTERHLFEVRLTQNAILDQDDVFGCPSCGLMIEVSSTYNRTSFTCSYCKAGKFCRTCRLLMSGYRCTNTYCAKPSLEINKTLAESLKKTIVGVPGCPSVRACPTCKSLIHHIGDLCKHMDCIYCNSRFCFICLSVKAGDYWECGGAFDSCTLAKVQQM
ncbi:uncharacterized protein [Argopecten irradians]|uniref:uncharacterized protein n=1 Tax=Argopecten irradians TaxID=31199 RepID=UPI003716AAC9